MRTGEKFGAVHQLLRGAGGVYFSQAFQGGSRSPGRRIAIYRGTHRGHVSHLFGEPGKVGRTGRGSVYIDRKMRLTILTQCESAWICKTNQRKGEKHE